MNRKKLFKKIRSTANLTQTDAAIIMGWASKDTIYKKESGRIPITDMQIEYLAMKTDYALVKTPRGEWA